ncbi:hypothetical protein ACSBR2_027227 [Camellia fascicularis]
MPSFEEMIEALDNLTGKDGMLPVKSSLIKAQKDLPNVKIFFLATIYAILGCPLSYVLRYRPFYRAMRLAAAQVIQSAKKEHKQFKKQKNKEATYNEGGVDNITVFLKVHKAPVAQYLNPSSPTDSSQKKSRQVINILESSLRAFFGGFGSVFQGTLSDGTKVAVKRLNGFGHVKKSFLAKVETIGNIHHVNLVRLIGFCDKKSYRLLVYEYMYNGSLDTWIFQRH